MTWKPTDEMIKAYHDAQQKALRECEEINCPSDHEVVALIAVQPLIAAQTKAEWEEAYLHAFREKFPLIVAEARAKALEEAATICEENAEDNADNARRHQQAIRDARDIRRLIPKPVEGT